MKKILKVGLTDQTIDVFIQDSSVTTGAGLSGLVYNSASLACYYRRGATGSATQLTLATQTVGGAHSDGGFVEIQATNMKGMYRLDLSDAIVASGVTTVTIMLYGATNMAPVTIELQLVAVDLDNTVRMGLTALPNAAADAAGGLVISDAGGLDADAQRSDVAAILVDTGTTLDGRIPAALVGGRMDANMGAISSDATAADNAEAFFDGTGYAGTGNVIPTVTLVNTLTTYTGNTVQTGDSFARIGVAGAGLTNIDLPNQTMDIVGTITTVTNLTNAPSDSSGVTTLLSRLPAGLFTGLTNFAQWLGLLGGKQVGNTTARTELNATGAGSGTYDETTDSTQAIRDAGATITDLGIMASTTIATLASQTSFTLTAGSADNDAYNGCPVIVTDASTAVQKAIGFISDYVGSTKTVTLKFDPAIFTMAVGDGIVIMPPQVAPSIKKAKALANFEFAMIDSTDDISGKTGVTVTAERSIDGGAFGACSNSASEVSGGMYKISLSSTDLDGDVITLKFTGTGCNATLITLVTEP